MMIAGKAIVVLTKNVYHVRVKMIQIVVLVIFVAKTAALHRVNRVVEFVMDVVVLMGSVIPHVKEVGVRVIVMMNPTSVLMLFMNVIMMLIVVVVAASIPIHRVATIRRNVVNRMVVLQITGVPQAIALILVRINLTDHHLNCWHVVNLVVVDMMRTILAKQDVVVCVGIQAVQATSLCYHHQLVVMIVRHVDV